MNQAFKSRAVVAVTVFAALASSAWSPTATAAGIKQDEQRLQVKMERDEFLKTHRYDPVQGSWVLKSEVLPPRGVKTREEIKAERDAFLRAHKWDRERGWIPLQAERNLSTLTRAEVKAETAQFNRTHRWEEARDSFVFVAPSSSRH
jgi:hypothetical protein